MCGNGIRCVAKYVYDHGIARKEELKIDTDAGVKPLRVFLSGGVVTRVRVNMGRPELERQRLPMRGPPGRVVAEDLEVLDRTFKVTAVNVGNPQCVSFVEGIETFDVAKYGPAMENHPSFPERAIVNFVEVVGSDRVELRTWDRGTGEVLACGTGACATCVAAVLNDLTQRSVTVHSPGGDLQIEWSEAEDVVYMTGPAREVFTGDWPDSEE